MARPSFYNDNLFRAYPFQEPAEGLPTQLVVDFGCVFLAGAPFISPYDQVVLARVVRSGSRIIFDFRTTTLAMEEWQLVFVRDIVDRPYITSFAVARPLEPLCSSSSSSSSLTPELPADTSPPGPGEEPCRTEPIWEGFLVTGDLSVLEGRLEDCQSLEGPWTILPSRVVNLSRSYVRSISIANADRTRATAPEGCFEYCLPFERKSHYVACDCLAGYVEFVPGHNMEIFVDPSDNSLSLEARPGSGLGPVCSDVPLFPGERPPEGRSTLDGALSCAEVVRSINGISRRFLTLMAGSGVIITSYPEEHKIVVNVSMRDLTVCPETPAPEFSSSLPEPERPC